MKYRIEIKYTEKKICIEREIYAKGKARRCLLEHRLSVSTGGELSSFLLGIIADIDRSGRLYLPEMGVETRMPIAPGARAARTLAFYPIRGRYHLRTESNRIRVNVSMLSLRVI